MAFLRSITVKNKKTVNGTQFKMKKKGSLTTSTILLTLNLNLYEKKRDAKIMVYLTQRY